MSKAKPSFCPSCSTCRIGFTPGDRMKNTPVALDVSSNVLENSITRPATYFSPRFSATKSDMA